MIVALCVLCVRVCVCVWGGAACVGGCFNEKKDCVARLAPPTWAMAVAICVLTLNLTST